VAGHRENLAAAQVVEQSEAGVVEQDIKLLDPLGGGSDFDESVTSSLSGVTRLSGWSYSCRVPA